MPRVLSGARDKASGVAEVTRSMIAMASLACGLALGSLSSSLIRHDSDAATAAAVVDARDANRQVLRALDRCDAQLEQLHGLLGLARENKNKGIGGPSK